MILARVVERLNLSVAQPDYAPIIGSAYARRLAMATISPRRCWA